MPFIGQDWRAPGESWMRTTEGWELVKLRPVRTCSELSDSDKTRLKTDSESSEGGLTEGCDEVVGEVEESEDWQPLVFLRTGQSKEFVGCTSMGEAFRKLDFAGAIRDVRRFNFVSKVLSLLIKERLPTLSGSARKILLELVELGVIHCLDSCCNLKTARDIVNDFFAGLTIQHHCGSPTLLIQQQETASNLFQLLTDVRFECLTPADSTEDRLTLLDLPSECLKSVLRQLPDHEGLLLAATAHQALRSMVDGEKSLWRSLCRFHFSQLQIEQIRQKLLNDAKKFHSMGRIQSCPSLRSSLPVELSIPKVERESVQNRDHKNNLDWSLDGGPTVRREESEALLTGDDGQVEHGDNWRRLYFELKKFHGLREVYAEMLHLCCFCKGLFWKQIGHPCIAKKSPKSVAVNPSQFVEMLCT